MSFFVARIIPTAIAIGFVLWASSFVGSWMVSAWSDPQVFDKLKGPEGLAELLTQSYGLGVMYGACAVVFVLGIWTASKHL